MATQGNVWLSSLIAVATVSGLSLVGAFSLLLRDKWLRLILIVLVAFAAGALLGDAFLHLLPETVEAKGEFGQATSFSVLAGVSTFFVLEKGLHWHHAHIEHHNTVHPVAITNLMGDALHNFLDGAIIAHRLPYRATSGSQPLSQLLFMRSLKSSATSASWCTRVSNHDALWL